MDESDLHGYLRVADVVRNDFVEGAHFGRVFAIDGNGATELALGDVERPFHPRSANKLMQAAAMVALGLDLENELLALAAASHWGQSKHVDAVRRILFDSGLDESALQCTPSIPHDVAASHSVTVTGQLPAAVYSGCSGKHAAMLRTCVINEWKIDDYLNPSHKLQIELHRFVEDTIGQPTQHTAVDGCGAPAWAISMRQLASAYRDAVLAPDRSGPLARVADAMRAFPEYVCGDASEVTGLMRAVPGMLVKDGAEAVYVAAVPDGRAVVVKVADGGFRAAQVVLVAALVRLGVASAPAIGGVDADAFARWGTVAVTGHGEPVGEIRPAECVVR